jgi:uroporphyrinogen-III synthase
MRRLFILRPEPGASASVARAAALGLEAVAIPLFEIVASDWQVPDVGAFDGLVLTSANALRWGKAGLEQLRGLPVFAVGKATAEAAREAGFVIAGIGAGDGADLMREVAAGHLGGGRAPASGGEPRFLHLCGAEHVALPGTVAVAVYEARALAVPDGLAALPGQVAAVHSARAAARLREFCAVLELPLAGIRVAAISARAAAALGPGWEAVSVAERPDDPALLAAAARLCHTDPR